MITLKSLQAKLTMIKLTADRRGVKLIGMRFPVDSMRIQTGPGGKRLVCSNEDGYYEITTFMPARDLNIYMNGLWLGMDSHG